MLYEIVAIEILFRVIYLFLFVMLVSYTFSSFFRYYFIVQNDDISLFNSRARVTSEHRQVTISNTFFILI